MLPEDLLKSHTIHELRDAVSSLERDCSSKQKELQQMVGSRYHDFIQSADSIANMRRDSSQAVDNLEEFSNYCDQLAINVKDLLSRTALTESKQASLHSMKIGSSLVWTHLDQCDIFAAAKVVALSHILLSTPGTPSIPDSDFLPKAHLPASMIPPLSSVELADIQSAAFLAETVIEDSSLLLVDESGTIVEKAKTLAAVGMLTGKGPVELFSLHLQSSLVILRDTLEAVSLDHQENGERESLDKELYKIASLLQRVIIEIHVLFFRKLDRRRRKSGHLSMTTGLVAAFQFQWIGELEEDAFSFCTSKLSGKKDDEKLRLREVGLGLVPTCSDADPAALRAHFEEWFDIAAFRVIDHLRSCLSRVTTVSTVAGLQQEIHHACCHVLAFSSTQGASTKSSSEGCVSVRDLFLSYGTEDVASETVAQFPLQLDSKEDLLPNQEDWEAASAELLSYRKRRQRKFSRSMTSTAEEIPSSSCSYMWVFIFQQPFLDQIEHLLQRCSKEAFERICDKLFQCLSQHCQLSFDVDAWKLISPDAKERKGVLRLTSSACHSIAAEFIDQLENEFEELIGEFSTNTTGTSKEGWQSAAMIRAVHVQSSQLTARVLIALRSILNELVTVSKAHHSPNILCGILLVGRCAWLMKQKGRFLVSALSLCDYEKGSSGSTFYACTEEQLRSSCEIADTDGDGLLTRVEIIEAIQSLAIGEILDQENSSEGLDVRFLDKLRSATFCELVLLAVHLLPPASSRLVHWINFHLDSLIAYAHFQWAKSVITETNARYFELFVGSFKETSLSSDSSQSRQQLAPSFLSNWISVEISLESADNETTFDRMKMPNTLSTHLLKFLNEVTAHYNRSLVSLDTVQPLIDLTQFQSSNHGDDETDFEDFYLTHHLLGEISTIVAVSKSKTVVERLGSFVRLVIQHLLCRAVTDWYEKLFDVVVSNNQKHIEEVALQASFDLCVCKAVLASGAGLAGFVKILDGWLAQVDPVNLEMLSALRNAAIVKCAQQLSHLVVGSQVTSTSTRDSRNGAGAAGDALLVASVFTASMKSGDNPVARFAALPLPIGVHSIVSESQLARSGHTITQTKVMASRSHRTEAPSSSLLPTKTGVSPLPPRGATKPSDFQGASSGSSQGPLRGGIISSLGNLLGRSGSSLASTSTGSFATLLRDEKK